MAGSERDQRRRAAEADDRHGQVNDSVSTAAGNHRPSVAPVPGDAESTPQDLAQALQEIRHLEIALASRTTIATAVGIVMMRHRLTLDDAFQWLVTLSQHTNEKLRVIAAERTGVRAVRLRRCLSAHV